MDPNAYRQFVHPRESKEVAPCANLEAVLPAVQRKHCDEPEELL